MKNKRAFTLIELLVVIAVIAVLFGILMPALNRAKEAGKRSACMANMKTLGYAWYMYADDYSDKIVSGRLGTPNKGAPAWCGDASAGQSGQNAVPKTQEQQEIAIRSGALYPYVKTLYAYKCSTVVRGEYESYAIVDGMNGEGYDLSAAEKVIKGVICSSRADIKQPSSRIVFLDEGYITPSSFAVRYSKEYWYDIPAIRHGGGCTFSFADAHIDYFKWTGQNTLKMGKIRDLGASSGNTWVVGTESTPLSREDQIDLQFIQKGCFGKFNYSPKLF